MNIPDDNVLDVCRYLNDIDLLNLSLVSKKFYQISSSDIIWKVLCEKFLIGECTKQLCDIFANYYKTYKFVQKKYYLRIKNFEINPNYDCFKKQFKYSFEIDKYDMNVKNEIHISVRMANYAVFLYKGEKHIFGTDNWEKACNLMEHAIEKTTNSVLENDMIFVHFGNLTTIYPQKCIPLFETLLKKDKTSIKILIRYIEFLYKDLKMYKSANICYSGLLEKFPLSGKSFSAFATFSWKYMSFKDKENLQILQRAIEYDVSHNPGSLCILAHFMAKKTRHDLSCLVEESKLYEIYCTMDEKDSNYDFYTESLALSYNETGQFEESFNMFKKIINKESPITITNCAEIMLHKKLDFFNAEKLYEKALKLSYGSLDIAEIALCGLHLANNKIEYLPKLKTLLEQPHIQKNKDVYTQGLIIYLIHCKNTEKFEYMQKIKYNIITLNVRPFLSIYFYANLAWLKKMSSHYFSIRSAYLYDFIEHLINVFNGSMEASSLNDYYAWQYVFVPNVIVCDDDTPKILKEALNLN